MLNAKAVPKLERRTKTAIALSILKKQIISVPPRVAIPNAQRNVILIPRSFRRKPLVMYAAIPDTH